MINKLKATDLNNAFIFVHMIHLKFLLFFYFNEKKIYQIYFYQSKLYGFWFSFVDFLLMKKDCIQLKY